MTSIKEGTATLGQYLMAARNAQTAAGGPGTAAGDAEAEFPGLAGPGFHNSDGSCG